MDEAWTNKSSNRPGGGAWHRFRFRRPKSRAGQTTRASHGRWERTRIRLRGPIAHAAGTKTARCVMLEDSGCLRAVPRRAIALSSRAPPGALVHERLARRSDCAHPLKTASAAGVPTRARSRSSRQGCIGRHDHRCRRRGYSSSVRADVASYPPGSLPAPVAQWKSGGLLRRWSESSNPLRAHRLCSRKPSQGGFPALWPCVRSVHSP